MELTTIGGRVRHKRLEKGYSQHALAEKLEIGNVYLSEIERNKKLPSINTLIKLATVLEVSADYILRGTMSPAPTYKQTELTRKLDTLTPKQLRTVHALLKVYVDSLE